MHIYTVNAHIYCTHFCLHLCLAKIAKISFIGGGLFCVVLVVHLVLVVLLLLTLAKDLLLGVGCSTLSCLCTLSCLQWLKISYWGVGCAFGLFCVVLVVHLVLLTMVKDFLLGVGLSRLGLVP